MSVNLLSRCVESLFNGDLVTLKFSGSASPMQSRYLSPYNNTARNVYSGRPEISQNSGKDSGMRRSAGAGWEFACSEGALMLFQLHTCFCWPEPSNLHDIFQQNQLTYKKKNHHEAV